MNLNLHTYDYHMLRDTFSKILFLVAGVISIVARNHSKNLYSN